MASTVIESNQLWDSSWFAEDDHICEYAAIHAPLLNIYQYGMPIITSCFTSTNGLDMIMREPFGLSGLEVDENDFFLQEACSTIPPALEVGQFTATIDCNSVCCINMAGGSMYWWIHSSKLCLVAPKSKRRGLTSDDKRHLTLVGLVTLTDYIMKKVCTMLPGLSAIPNTTLSTCLATLFLRQSYAHFCMQLANKTIKRTSMLMEKFPNQSISSLIHSCSLGIIPCDITWFTSRMNVWQKVNAVVPGLPLSLILQDLQIFAGNNGSVFT